MAFALSAMLMSGAVMAESKSIQRSWSNSVGASGQKSLTVDEGGITRQKQRTGMNGNSVSSSTSVMGERGNYSVEHTGVGGNTSTYSKSVSQDENGNVSVNRQGSGPGGASRNSTTTWSNSQ